MRARLQRQESPTSTGSSELIRDHLAWLEGQAAGARALQNLQTAAAFEMAAERLRSLVGSEGAGYLGGDPKGGVGNADPANGPVRLVSQKLERRDVEAPAEAAAPVGHGDDEGVVLMAGATPMADHDADTDEPIREGSGMGEDRTKTKAEQIEVALREGIVPERLYEPVIAAALLGIRSKRAGKTIRAIPDEILPVQRIGPNRGLRMYLGHNLLAYVRASGDVLNEGETA